MHDVAWLDSFVDLAYEDPPVGLHLDIGDVPYLLTFANLNPFCIFDSYLSIVSFDSGPFKNFTWLFRRDGPRGQPPVRFTALVGAAITR